MSKPLDPDLLQLRSQAVEAASRLAQHYRASLTPREHEVVALVAEGLGDKEIAERLGTAVSTVKNHLANVYVKWRVRSRTEAAVRCVKVTGK